MKAKGNHIADAEAIQAALNCQIIQSREWFLLATDSIRYSLLQFQQTATEEK